MAEDMAMIADRLNGTWTIYVCPGCLQQRETPWANAHCECLDTNGRVPYSMAVTVRRQEKEETLGDEWVPAGLQIQGAFDEKAAER